MRRAKLPAVGGYRRALSASSQADQGEILIPGAVAAGGHLWSSVLVETSFHLATVCIFVCTGLTT